MLKVDESFSSIKHHLEFLDPYAVQCDIVTLAEARLALTGSKAIRKFVRQKLDLKFGANRKEAPA